MCWDNHCSVFLDRSELLKRACQMRFISDVWKRFVGDEEIDCSVNYGFTSNRCFGEAMKIQELNYENVPVIEESRDASNPIEAQLPIYWVPVLGSLYTLILSTTQEPTMWVPGF